MKSVQTKKIQTKLLILKIINSINLLLPILYYVVMSFGKTGVSSDKQITLVICLAVAGILLILNYVLKYKLRSPLFIVLIGVHLVIGDIMTLIVILAVTSILDELVLNPMINNAKSKLITNKELDKRL